MIPSHLALSLLNEKSGTVDKILSKTNFKKKNALKEFNHNIDVLPTQDPPPAEITGSSLFYQCLRLAGQYAADNGDTHIAVDHLLLSLFDDSKISTVLVNCDLTRDELKKAVKQVK